MNKKIAAFLSVLVILVFIGYMVFDTSKSEGPDKTVSQFENVIYPDGNWEISEEFKVKEGTLKAVTVAKAGNIYLGGESFVSCYDSKLNQEWTLESPAPVTGLAFFGDTIYASTTDMILLISNAGKLLNEFGPFENNSIITSVSVNKTQIAFADAGNKTIFLLDKGGEVKRMIGRNDAYFDVALDSAGLIYVANTGHRRLEIRNNEGITQMYFGEPGTAPDAFCGCCNPAHFVKIKNGFVTAEKGINRIKILGDSGEFIEFVSSKNDFLPSVPLDLASVDGNTIYAANSYDSKLYIFTRK